MQRFGTSNARFACLYWRPLQCHERICNTKAELRNMEAELKTTNDMLEKFKDNDRYVQEASPASRSCSCPGGRSQCPLVFNMLCIS